MIDKFPQLRTRKSRHSQSGTTLIEILVTLFVLAVGLLGAAGLQLTAVRYQQTAHSRAQAMIQTQIIVEKMRANTAGILAPFNSYLLPNDFAAAGVIPADPGCGLVAGPVGCTPAQAAQRDIRDWQLSLVQSLPQGRGSIFPVTSGGLTEVGTRRVVIMWVEKAQDSDDVAGTDPDCPAPAVAGVRCYVTQVTP